MTESLGCGGPCRCVGSMTMPQALAQSLQCPLLDPSYRLVRLAMPHCATAAQPLLSSALEEGSLPHSNSTAAHATKDKGSTLLSHEQMKSVSAISTVVGSSRAELSAAGVAVTGRQSKAAAAGDAAPGSVHVASDGAKADQRTRNSAWEYSVAAGQGRGSTLEADMYTSFMVAGKRRVSKRAPRKHQHHRCVPLPSRSWH